MLDAAVLLDLSVAAVVVGQQKSFRGDQLSCTSSSEEHDGILQRCLVDAVDVLCVEPEALFLHVSDSLRDE